MAGTERYEPGQSPGGPSGTAALTGRHLVAALILTLATLGLGAYHAVPGVIGSYHDDGIYVSTAWSIASGAGYAHPSLPEPLAQTKYPPLLPLAFSAIWLVRPDFPQNAVLFQAVCLLGFAVGIGLSFLYLVRFGYAAPVAAFCGVSLTATSSVLLFWAAIPMADGPFLLAAIVALWMLEKAVLAEEHERLLPFLAGLALAGAALTKSAAGAFLPGAAIVLFASGRRKLVAFLAGAIVPVISWHGWATLARGGGNAGPFAYYVDYAQDWTGVGLAEMPKIAAANAMWLLEGVGQDALPGALFVLKQITPRVDVFFLVVGLAAVWTLFGASPRRRLLTTVWAPYLAVCVIHPWPPGRFVLPLLPLLAGTVCGSVASAWGGSWKFGARAAAGVFAALLGLNVALVAVNARRQHEQGYPSSPLVHPLPKWSVYQESFDWIRLNTSKDDVIAAGLDPMLWLHTGRKSYRPFVSRPLELYYSDAERVGCDPEELWRLLREGGADYLIDAPMPGFRVERQFRQCVEALAARPGSPLTSVFVDRLGKAVVYRVAGA